jgi:hypothetical protein
MDRDAVIHRLAETIAGDGELLLDGWTHLVLTSRLEDGMLNMNGFCYTDDSKAVPVSPTDFSIFDVLHELRDAMAKGDGGAVPDRARDWQAQRRVRVQATRAVGHNAHEREGARARVRAGVSSARCKAMCDHLTLEPPLATP